MWRWRKAAALAAHRIIRRFYPPPELWRGVPVYAEQRDQPRLRAALALIDQTAPRMANRIARAVPEIMATDSFSKFVGELDSLQFSIVDQPDPLRDAAVIVCEGTRAAVTRTRLRLEQAGIERLSLRAVLRFIRLAAPVGCSPDEAVAVVRGHEQWVEESLASRYWEKKKVHLWPRGEAWGWLLHGRRLPEQKGEP